MGKKLRIAVISLYALENNGVRHVATPLREAGYSMVSNFLDRQRIDLPIDAAQASLESQRV